MDTSWASSCPIVRLITQEELSKATEADLVGSFSSVLKLKAEGRRHFDGAAVPISNDLWKERWTSMCSAQTDDVLGGLDENEEDRKKKERELEEQAERWRAAPSFLQSECNMTRLGKSVPLLCYVSLINTSN